MSYSRTGVLGTENLGDPWRVFPWDGHVQGCRYTESDCIGSSMFQSDFKGTVLPEDERGACRSSFHSCLCLLDHRSINSGCLGEPLCLCPWQLPGAGRCTACHHSGTFCKREYVHPHSPPRQKERVCRDKAVLPVQGASHTLSPKAGGAVRRHTKQAGPQLAVLTAPELQTCFLKATVSRSLSVREEGARHGAASLHLGNKQVGSVFADCPGSQGPANFSGGRRALEQDPCALKTRTSQCQASVAPQSPKLISALLCCCF